jgi:hypothetical protein
MPQNAIIRADGTGDYTSIIAWEAAEQSSDYGAPTVGRVDGFFDQGSTSLILNGTWPQGGRLEPFDSTDAFDGTERQLCGLTTSNGTRAIDFVLSTNFEIDGLEIYYTGGSGTDRTLENSGTGTFTILNALIKTEGNKRTWLGNFTFNDSVIATTATTNAISNGASSTFNRCNFFSASSSTMGAINSSQSFDTVSVALNTSSFNGGSNTNCASEDGTATAFPNIVVADNFVDPDPLGSGDYRIQSGSVLDTNGIGAFVQSTTGISVTVQSLSQSQTIDNVTLTQNNIMALNGLSQIQTLDNVTLTIAGEVDINGLSQGQTIENIELTQANILFLNRLDQLQFVENITLQTGTPITVQNLSQVQTLENIDLSLVTEIVNINNISQDQSIDNVTLLQTSVIQIDSLSQSQLLESINFGGVVIGYLEGQLTIFYALDGNLIARNALNGDIMVYNALDGNTNILG